MAGSFLCLFAVAGQAQSPAPLPLPSSPALSPGYVEAFGLPDGARIVTGDFQAINGKLRRGIVKLDALGAVDPAFNPPQDLRAEGVDSSGNVYAVEDIGRGQLRLRKLDAETGLVDPLFVFGFTEKIWKLVVAGQHVYLTLGGAFLNESMSLLRLSRAAGLRDLSYQPIASGSADSAFAVDSAENVYIGMYRSPRALGKIRADGSIEPAWRATLPTQYSNVWDLLVHEPHLYLIQTSKQFSPNPQSVSRFALASGTVDPNFAIRSSLDVYTIAPLPSGDVLVGGNFNQINDQPIYGSARVSASGQVSPLVTPQPKGPVYSIVAQSDGSAFISGQFDFDDKDLCCSAAQVEPDGRLGSKVASFEASGNVSELARTFDGNVIATGRFRFNDSVLTRRLARFRTTGSLDSSWVTSAPGNVIRLATHANYPWLIAGGVWLRPASDLRVAEKFDVTGSIAENWSAPQEGYGQNGVVAVTHDGWVIVGRGSRLERRRVEDPGIRDPNWPAASLPQQTIARLMLDGDGGLYVGMSRGILKLREGDGAEIWRNTTSASVYVFALQDGQLFAGGAFRSVASASTSTSAQGAGLARMDAATGAVDSTWTATVTAEDYDQYVLDLASLPNQELIVAGSFARIGGSDRSNIARINTSGSGSVIQSWDPRPNLPVSALLAVGESVWIGGSFTKVGDHDRFGIAALPLGATTQAIFDDTFE